MGLIPGDEITLISPNGKVTAFGTVPRMKSYKIIGTFEVGMYEYDSNFIFMPLAAAQTYFGMKGAVSNIDVTLDSDTHLREVRKAIEESVGAGAYIYDWKQTNSAFFNAIAVERNVMFIILTLIILVAAFNIITGLIMLVKDKGRDIAVLRTMGATKGMIMRIFLWTGLLSAWSARPSVWRWVCCFATILRLFGSFCRTFRDGNCFRPKFIFCRSCRPKLIMSRFRSWW